MDKKFDALDKIKEFKIEQEKQLGKHITTLQLDQGGEYMCNEFDYFLLEYEIISQLSAPITSQQNRVVKKK